VSEEVRKYLAHARELSDAALDELLPRTDEPPGRLHESMRYSCLAPGKRLRPALALATCRAFAGEEEVCRRPAAALEMIHAYSLIHDDLPAMDDDDLRRGQPTNHVVYGDAMAILAGDALHTLACQVLAEWPRGDELAAMRSRVLAAVLDGIGWRGMVGGQVLDIELTGRAEAGSLEEVGAIHTRKTGALFRASLVLGAEVAGASSAQVKRMAHFGDVAGLAFQVVDDILDVTAESSALGKTGGKDEAAGKGTYPAVLGLEGAREVAESLTAEALELLEGTDFPEAGDAAPLRALTHFILERNH
jgi:geranylgeranyl diphosphate synthase type II